MTPSTVTLSAPGASGTTSIALAGFVANTISLSCSGLPSEATCAFGTLTGTGLSGTVSLQITSTAASSAALRKPLASLDGVQVASMFALPCLLAFGLRRRRGGVPQLFLWLLLAASGFSIVGCGGSKSSGTSNPGTPVGTTAVTVAASAAAQTSSGSLTLTIQ